MRILSAVDFMTYSFEVINQYLGKRYSTAITSKQEYIMNEEIWNSGLLSGNNR